MSPKKLNVSVTSLADFSCKVGDLELSGSIGPTALEGMRAHKKIQAQRDVEIEHKLSLNIIIEDVLVLLSGRVDLLDEHQHRVSEIKTTLIPAARLSKSKIALQWAQLKLYGFCYCVNREKDGDAVPTQGIELELIHANIRAETEESQVVQTTFPELTAFAHDALTRYVRWNKIVWQLQARTKCSAAAMSFPYQPYRDGQRDMAAAIFRSTRDGETLLCEAPTGTGKTLSGLFPVVKALGEGYVKHAVYLTAKTSGRQSAMQAIQTLEQAGLQATSVMLRSKAPTCFCSNGRCERNNENVCPMTIGFFDRLPTAREEAIAGGVLDGAKLDEIAWQHQLCPFELALQMLPWVSLAIADFNYVFDPLVRIGRFNESRADTALLIDEAHNLVDRARGMHSGHLSRRELIKAHNLVESSHPVLAGQIKSLCSALERFASEQSSSECVSEDVPKTLVKQAGVIIEAFTDALESGPVMPEPLFDTFKMACRFVAISEIYGEQHKVITFRDSANRNREINVTLKCLDAATYLKPQYKIFRSTVVFSATLRPALFYRDALGMNKQTQQLVIGSPFSADQVKHCIVGYINTRYKHRSASTPDLIDLLRAMVDNKPGNYMVFFPSYSYLQHVLTAFTEKHANIETWQQERQADIEQRARLLDRLEHGGTRLGFAILGGFFGESIDYVGDKLIGVALVGVGLPGIGIEQDLIADCYRAQGLNGFDYAYRYPGFTKVLQTAGRVIRTESDRGVVFLVDDRFNQPFYRNLYPPHWQLETANSLTEVQQTLSGFWQAQSQLALS